MIILLSVKPEPIQWNTIVIYSQKLKKDTSASLSFF